MGNFGYARLRAYCVPHMAEHLLFDCLVELFINSFNLSAQSTSCTEPTKSDVYKQLNTFTTYII